VTRHRIKKSILLIKASGINSDPTETKANKYQSLITCLTIRFCLAARPTELKLCGDAADRFFDRVLIGFAEGNNGQFGDVALQDFFT
jgi:hypothetical protein